MEALSPRSTNIQLKQKNGSKKEQLEAKAATARKLQREKDHPPAPPACVREPDGPYGEKGGRYLTGKFLGKGGFAICYEGELQDGDARSTGHCYALKIVKSVMPQPKMTEKFKTELQIHSKMHHPNIVEFHRAFTFEQSTYIVLGLCENGSMMDMVRKRRYLTEPEVRRHVIQTCGAIKYMHHKNVIHRDLKMGNIFLDRDMNVKIGDFGLAALLVSDKEYSANRRRTLCGTPNYIAPEVLEKGQKGHDYKVDIWSLGIIIFAMLTGFPPFQSKTQEEIYRKVKARDYLWPSSDKCPNEISQNAQDLVATLLVQAEDRPEPDDIVSHPFFQQGMVSLSIDAGARHTAPSFPKGHSEHGGSNETTWYSQWTTLCRQCGVGNRTKKQSFPLVGEELDKTTYQECRLEEKAGRTPIVPIPADRIYRPFPDTRTWPIASQGGPEDQDLLQIGRAKDTLRGMPSKAPYSSVQDAFGRQSKTLPRNAMIKMVAAEPLESCRQDVKSHAAKLREQSNAFKNLHITKPPTEPSADRRIAGGTVQAEIKKIESEPKLLRGGAVRPSNRETGARTVSGSAVTARVTRSQSIQGNLCQETLRGTAPRRNGLQKSASSRTLMHGALPATEEEQPRSEPKIKARAHAVGNEIVAHQVAELGDAMGDTKDRRTEQPPDDRTTAIKRSKSSAKLLTALDRTVPRPVLIAPEELGVAVPGTTPEATHRQLSLLLCNLDNVLDQNSQTMDCIDKRTKTFPIVIKWVDYTNKFGIGYILSEGSVGCLLNADKDTPSTCIVVRDGETHVRRRDLKTYSARHQVIPLDGPPIEFFENRGGEGLKLAFVDSREFQEQVGLDEASEKPVSGLDEFDGRKRRMVVLWRKFANYMTDALGKSEDSTGKDSSSSHDKRKTAACGPFVRFYQRFADVGVWGFGHGGFQFNFPDHTKLVLSADASHCDFYHLPVAAARQLQRNGMLQDTALEKRTVLSYPTQNLVSGRWRDENFADVVQANQLEEKLHFIRSIMRLWQANGGLGKMGKETRLEWRGTRELKPQHKPEKLVWVTVGAAGGDSRISEIRAV